LLSLLLTLNGRQYAANTQVQQNWLLQQRKAPLGEMALIEIQDRPEKSPHADHGGSSSDSDPCILSAQWSSH
jgi:hypothetical protein